MIEEEGAPIGITLDDTKPDGSVPAIMGLVNRIQYHQRCGILNVEWSFSSWSAGYSVPSFPKIIMIPRVILNCVI